MSPARLRYYLASVPVLARGIRNWPAVAAALLRPPPRPPFEVTLRSGLRFRVTGALDVWILKEVCLDREYERHGTAIRDGWSVVDIGAGLGEFAISVAREHPGCRVYAFEPCDEALTLLRENVDLNEVRNVTPLPYAVAARGGVSVLRVPARRRATASTARTPGGGASRSVPVPCVTLREAFRDLGIRRCDFLKLDCEGAEYEIMLGADADTTDRIAHIGMEYHEGVAGRSVGDLVGFLRSRGFSVRTVPNPAHPRAMGLLYATS